MIEVRTHPGRALTLRARTAGDLMTSSPLSLRDTATLREAIAFLIDRNISGAPVIDEPGRPVGVLTQTDVLVHDRETVEHVLPEYDGGRPLPRAYWDEFQIERVDTTLVRDVMTPAVFSIAETAPAVLAIAQMRDLKVHRLFVVDENGILVGVISAMDVLRHLELPER
jgi:CBS domain-containing protein